MLVEVEHQIVLGSGDCAAHEVVEGRAFGHKHGVTAVVDGSLDGSVVDSVAACVIHYLEFVVDIHIGVGVDAQPDILGHCAELYAGVADALVRLLSSTLFWKTALSISACPG